MWTAVLTIATLALGAGVLLSLANRRLPGSAEPAIEEVNRLLPQTQCAQCGYPGCEPYARAIVVNDAAINLCPPGGDETVRRLANLLGRDAESAIPPASSAPPFAVAVVDEERCIGCTHCRTACPVDAIVGAHQYLHTVIETECTGCELCVAPCPVDCISMEIVR